MVVRAHSDISTLKGQNHHYAFAATFILIQNDTITNKGEVIGRINNLSSVDASGSNWLLRTSVQGNLVGSWHLYNITRSGVGGTCAGNEENKSNELQGTARLAARLGLWLATNMA